jgi:hypothetical protein
MGVRRILTTLLVIATACGGATSDTRDSSNGSVADEPTATRSDATTTQEDPGDVTTTASPDTTRAAKDADSPTADLPLAPDFTLELGTGGGFTLSSTDNPVYLVFWAEW